MLRLYSLSLGRQWLDLPNEMWVKVAESHLQMRALKVSDSSMWRLGGIKGMGICGVEGVNGGN